MAHYQLHKQWIDADSCPDVIAAVESLVETASTPENVRLRKAYHYTNRWQVDDKFAANAFAIHYPGSADTDDLPGFSLDELPAILAELTRRACKALAIDSGRVFLNIARYKANCHELEAHFDGELFDFTIEPGKPMVIRRGIRPDKVAVLTLINNAVGGGTRLHPQDDDEAFVVDAAAGDLLQFSNLHYQHSGVTFKQANADAGDGWHRYIIGWRAFEDNCYQLTNNELSAVSVTEAAQLHREFLIDEWPAQAEAYIEAMAL